MNTHDPVRERLIETLQDTRCPICETAEFDREVYAMNFETEDLNTDVFSARRLPDRLHYRMVRCQKCGLLRSNPVLPKVALSRLYEDSEFTYATEAAFARTTYGHYFRKARAYAKPVKRLLEIGCGNGFFLEEALALGVSEVTGIEPASAAIAAASEAIRPKIRACLYDVDTFTTDRFDFICSFQTFDHVPDPAAMVAASFKDLAPGGVVLFVTHDSGAPLARLLGERNPIVDVEHTALFDKRTIRRIFEKYGFEICEVLTVQNTYPLSYWTRMVPLPRSAKNPLLWLLSATRVGRIPIRLPAGNLGIIARRPIEKSGAH
jgi:SAM-dependent methyltransferase